VPDTPKKLRDKIADVDRLLAEADKVRKEVTDQLRHLHDDDRKPVDDAATQRKKKRKR